MEQFTQLVEIGDTLIQFGIKQKTPAELRVDFARQFNGTPAVSVTPVWENKHAQVDNIETIDTIAANFFVVRSNNSARNYFVSWIAIGRK